MNYSKFNYLLLGFLIISGCNAQPNLSTELNKSTDTEWINSLLEDFKKNENIHGLAFAIFDNAQIIKEICLGESTYNYQIDRHTLFSIQSISKSITALAVMFAVQDSILILDNSISEYLSEFTIQSCFEDNPEQKITLEMLLSHTAGFTHEAPVGNNFEFDQSSFSEHLNSISETWLKFPAGSNYAYSNLGFDMAAHIIEQASGMEFSNYLSKKIFVPLGMELTTINDREVVESKNKTEGTIRFTKIKHLQIPLIGSGAVYTNLHDFINYVQFLMCNGHADETTIDNRYLFNMYTIRRNNYGLGTYIGTSDNNIFVNHNGGGYGYSASYIWFVEYNLGGVLLCNSQCDTYNATEKILKEYIIRTNRKRDTSLSKAFQEINMKYFENPEVYNAVQRSFCTNDTLYNNQWEKYLGTYSLVYKGLDPKWFTKLVVALGYHPQKLDIYQENQLLKIKSQDGVSILREYKEGLFFTNEGEVVDFSSGIPTYRNIKLEKIK